MVSEQLRRRPVHHDRGSTECASRWPAHVGTGQPAADSGRGVRRRTEMAWLDCRLSAISLLHHIGSQRFTSSWEKHHPPHQEFAWVTRPPRPGRGLVIQGAWRMLPERWDSLRRQLQGRANCDGIVIDCHRYCTGWALRSPTALFLAEPTEGCLQMVGTCRYEVAPADLDHHSLVRWK
jgi:hypothetical protein